MREKIMKLLRGDEEMGSLGITIMCNSCSTREEMVELFKTPPSEEIGVVRNEGYYVGSRRILIRKTEEHTSTGVILYIIRRLRIVLFKNNWSIYLLDISYLDELPMPSDFKIIEI